MILNVEIAAVVTGAASGLGAATARMLAAEGVKVALFDRSVEAGETLAHEIGGTFCEVDVTSDESVALGFAKARQAHGQERILVNCAGIVTGARIVGRDRATGAVRPFPQAMFEKTVAVNLFGTFRCLVTSAAGMASLEALADGERGVIINTASVAATDGQIGQAAYSASKAAVMGMNLSIARDLASDGIRINTILPGIIETPMMATMSEDTRSSLAASVPFPKRLGRPDEFGSLVREICRNAYLNGEAIRLDGAIRMAPR